MRPDLSSHILLEEFVDGGVSAKTFSLFRGRRGRRFPSRTNTTENKTFFHFSGLYPSFTESTCKNQEMAVSPFSLAFTHLCWQETASVCKQKQTCVNNG